MLGWSEGDGAGGATLATRAAGGGETEKLLKCVGRGFQTKETANANAETQRHQRAGPGRIKQGQVRSLISILSVKEIIRGFKVEERSDIGLLLACLI